MKIKQIIKKIRGSKDGKVLVDNFISLSLLQVAGYLFPLITIPYLARVIGVDKFGEIAFASAVIIYCITIVDWGFNYTATRDVAKNRDNIEKISEIFSNVMWARLFLMAVSFIILVILILIVPKFQEMTPLLLITFCIVPGHILFPEWLFQGLERMKYITILNLLAKLFFTIAVFVFIKEKSDFILQPLFVTLGFVLSGIISMYFIMIKWKIKLYRPSLNSLKNTIKKSADVFLNNLTPNLYNSFSTLLLGFLGGAVAVGKLDAGSKFVNISQQFTTVISRTFYPFLTRRIDKHDLYTKINVYLSSVISLLLFICAPLLIKFFFTPEFYRAILVLQIMSVSIFFLALISIYGTNYMIIQGHEKQLRNITLICSIIGFALSFPLIYFFNYIGAAITVTLTRGILGISIMCRARMIKNAL